MITLDYVIYDCIANVFLLAFAVFLIMNVRFAWVMVLCSLAIKVYIYGKYGMFSSSIYLSAQMLTSLLATLVWFRTPFYTDFTKNRCLFSLVSCLVILAIWIGLMYKYINPAVIDYTILFGFEYLCYMLFVVGSIFVVFRLYIGLIPLAVVFISYAVNYASSAMAMANSPQYIRDFIPYYWISAVFLFIAGILTVMAYTKVKRNI